MLLYIRLWAGDGDGARINRELRNYYIKGEGIDLLRCLLKGAGLRRPKSRLTVSRHRHSGNPGHEHRIAERAVVLFARKNQRIFHIHI